MSFLWLAILLHFGFSTAQLTFLIAIAMKLHSIQSVPAYPSPPDPAGEGERYIRPDPP